MTTRDRDAADAGVAPPPPSTQPDPIARSRAALNEVEFPGLYVKLFYLKSEQFSARFGSELQCRRYLLDAKWPNGFRCPKCGLLGPRPDPMQKVVRCSNRDCRHATTLTAQTIFHATKRPLTLWFQAALLIAQRGANARTLARELKLTYKIAWTWAHKLRRAMALEPRAESVEDARRRLAQERPGRAIPPSERWLAMRAGVSTLRVFGDPQAPRACCRKLEALDWQWPEPEFDPADLAEDGPASRPSAFVDVERYVQESLHPSRATRGRRESPQYAADDGAFARRELGPAYHGGISEKHLNAYLVEYSFKNNHRLARRDPVLPLLERLVRTGRHGYREITGRRPAEDPLHVFMSVAEAPLFASVTVRSPPTEEDPS